jgi:transcription-repair coupling factor (superfamily II helicase)
MLEKVINSAVVRELAERLTPGRAVQLTGVWGSASAMVAAALGRATGRPVLFVCKHLDDADTTADDLEVFLKNDRDVSLATICTPCESEPISNPSPSGGGGESAGQQAGVRAGGGDEEENKTLTRPWGPTSPKGRGVEQPGATGFPKPVPLQSSPDLKAMPPAVEAVHLFPAWEVQLATDHVSEEVTCERLGVLNLLADTSGGHPGGLFIVAPVMALLQPVPSPAALTAGRLRVERADVMELDALLEWLVDAGYDAVEQVDAVGQFAHRGGIVDVFPPAGLDARHGTARAIRIEFFGDEIDSIRRFDLDSQRSVEAMEAIELTAMSMGHVLPKGDGGQACPPYKSASGGGASEAVTHLLDYLPAETIICMVEPGEVRELADELYGRVRDDLVAGDDEASPVALREVDDVFRAMDRFARVGLFVFGGQRGRESLRLGVRSLERLTVGTAEALTELEELAGDNDVAIYCENHVERNRFTETLAESYPTLQSRAQLRLGHIGGGFHWPELSLVVAGHHEIYHRYAKVRRIRRVRSGRPINSLLDLNEGDYVVHVGHGIAKFDGLRRLERDLPGRPAVSEEYLRLRFADNAVLHVPVSQINLVQKYIGSRGKRPSLSKLGGAHWARAKERVGEAVKDLAADLLRLQAARRAMPGESYPPETELQRQFAAEFLYSETEDQLAALGQIDADMARPTPMDRLICGDVGYGKTELAMRAALKVVEAGRQVGVLVPTTVLADQHYRTFSERFADYPVRIDVISRFRTAGEQAKVCKQLRAGQIDILIGTHRLLSDDVKFAELGLVVVDEEQRFGVTHKEHLKQMRANVDVLTLTATPIPRTLHMAMMGLRDISSLQTPPLDRRAIHTEVCPHDDELIRTALRRELNRGGQVFFVHNRVQGIEAVANHVRSLALGARVDIGHGQMPETSLAEVMHRFMAGEIDVLVCTTIIESGLDIPTANTMIIDEADRFGLAELHQLRGRVGRYKHRAYCYLLLPQRRTVNPVAQKRLKAIEDFSDLGAGFQIAMRDLEIRGAGNILGPQQSGHIAVVGYELYCQLLEQSVRQLRGEQPAEAQPVEVHIELGIDAYLPRDYIPSERQRMEIYRRLVVCGSAADVAQVRADLADAFGPPPEIAELLLNIAEMRVHAASLGIESIILSEPDVVFRVKDRRRSEGVFADAPGSVRAPDARTLHWRPGKAWLEATTLLPALLRRLRQAGREET